VSALVAAHLVNCFATGFVAGQLWGEKRWVHGLIVFVSPHVLGLSVVGLG